MLKFVVEAGGYMRKCSTKFHWIWKRFDGFSNFGQRDTLFCFSSLFCCFLLFFSLFLFLIPKPTLGFVDEILLSSPLSNQKQSLSLFFLLYHKLKPISLAKPTQGSVVSWRFRDLWRAWQGLAARRCSTAGGGVVATGARQAR